MDLSGVARHPVFAIRRTAPPPVLSYAPTMASTPTIANAILSATDLEMRYGVQTVLTRATLAINEGDRIGLVGRNGTGKSTFLRIVAGVADPDAGQVVRRRELVTGYLPQDFQLDDAKTVEQNILMGAQQVLDLVAEYEAGPHRRRPRRRIARPHQPPRRLGRGAPRQGAHHASRRARRRPARGQPLGWGKTPRRAGPRAAGPAGFAHSRRADQPSRHREHRVAGRFPKKTIPAPACSSRTTGIFLIA